MPARSSDSRLLARSSDRTLSTPLWVLFSFANVQEDRNEEPITKNWKTGCNEPFTMVKKTGCDGVGKREGSNGVPENFQFLGRSGAAPGTYAKHGLASVPRGMSAKRSPKDESKRLLKMAATYSPTTCSTIGVAELNDPVRNGKGWDLSAITTLIIL